MSDRSGVIARNIVAVFCGLGGAALVVTIGTFVVFRSSFSAEDLARIRETTPGSTDFERAMTRISDPFDRVTRVTRTSTLVVFPAAALAMGLIVGGIASTRAGTLAALSTLLSSGALLIAGDLSFRSLILTTAYATLAGLSGRQMTQWQRSRGA